MSGNAADGLDLLFFQALDEVPDGLWWWGHGEAVDGGGIHVCVGVHGVRRGVVVCEVKLEHAAPFVRKDFGVLTKVGGGR